jgi:hypothetical protein
MNPNGSTVTIFVSVVAHPGTIKFDATILNTGIHVGVVPVDSILLVSWCSAQARNAVLDGKNLPWLATGMRPVSDPAELIATSVGQADCSETNWIAPSLEQNICRLLLYLSANKNAVIMARDTAVAVS